MPIMKVRDNNGNVSEIKALVGRKGDSAYKVAVANGFTGTEEQWLDSLKPALGTDYFTDQDKADIKKYIDDTTSETLTATNKNIDELQNEMITTKGNETENTKIIINSDASTTYELYTVEETNALVDPIKEKLIRADNKVETSVIITDGETTT